MDTVQLIAALLKNQGKVCVPGLGTFSATPGAPNAATELPAAGEENSDSSAFFPFLGGLDFSERHEKGNKVLADEIAGSRQINANLAGYEVDKFVIRVKQELSRNGSFEFSGMGKLTVEPGGKIGFQSVFNNHALFGLSPVALKPLERGGNVVEVISRKIGFKNVRQNKYKLIWAILIGLIILGLVSLLLVRLNIIG